MTRHAQLLLAVLSTAAFACAGAPNGGHDAGPQDAGPHDAGPTGFIGSLTITTIGSTVDATNGDQNPYGLAIAPITSGAMTAGDLIICNFNDSANVQGNGTTIEVLHPTPGSTPTRLVQDPNLQGCAAVSPDATDKPWAAAYSANLAPFYTSSGVLVSTLSAGPWDGPWGEIFVPALGSAPAYFVTSNATSGTLVNVNLVGSTFLTTVTGFSINAGAVPGTIYGVSGLTYDPSSDTMYAVDSNLNRVIKFAHYSSFGANAVTVGASGFTGPSASSASVLYAGSALQQPISAALLFNGDLVVGNTGGNSGQNVLVEISPDGNVVATQNLDTGAAGALFGIVATGTSAATAKIYFNDDNDNTVKVAAM